MTNPSVIPSIPPTSAPGLSPQQVTELIAARDGAAKIRRACGIARFDAWMVAIFAGITALTGITDVPSLLLGIGMGWVAWREFAGARQLRCLHKDAPRMLGINQLCLAAMLIVYALWQGYHNMTGPTALAAAAGGDAQLGQMLGPIDQLMKLITLSIYGALIFVAIFVQGSTALYYFTRQKHVEKYLGRTPQWITQLQRSGVAI